VIEVRNLTHRYGDRVALSNVGFEVKQGEIFGLLGPNGGGKSTLFRVLATMMAPTEGSASIAGHDVVREPAAVRRTVGVVFQTQSLDKALTVEENLRAQGHLHGLSGATLRERMEGAMTRLGIKDRRKDLVESLSGGLRRRVEIAKALLHRPQVLLMDEASTGLDPAARRDLSRHVEELRAQDGVTILLTTHILEEAGRCDRLILLHQGRIVAAGSPGELCARIGGDVVVLQATDDGAQPLAAQIEQRFGVRAVALDGQVRVEIASGHRFIADVVEAFPGAIESVGLHKPSLEDVFMKETGAGIE
jgi:ABC-2 type transport system ATP-binding protein